MSNADGGLDATGVFPKIFDLLHEGEGGEESIRRLTKRRLARRTLCFGTFSAVAESVIVIDHFVRGYVGTGDDELTIQHLGCVDEISTDDVFAIPVGNRA